MAETRTLGSGSAKASSKGTILRGSFNSFNASAAARRWKLVSCLSSPSSGATAALPAHTAARVFPSAISKRANSSLVEGFQPPVYRLNYNPVYYQQLWLHRIFRPAGITDALGAAYITGEGSFVSSAGALPAVENGGWILKLDSSGKIVFGTGFIGGGIIGLDSQGFIYVVGSADHSFNLPVTPGAFQTTVSSNRCGGNAFIGIPCGHQYDVKLDPTCTKLIYATWISGNYGAGPTAMAVDSGGSVTVAGSTASTDYPVTPGTYQTTSFATLPPRDTTSAFEGQSLEIPAHAM